MAKNIKDEFERFGAGDYKFFASDIEKEFGEDAIKPASSLENPEPNFSGSFGLDIALGVPIPEGRLVEIYGGEGAGKSTLALEILGQAQQKGKIIGYLNAECSLNRSLFESIRSLDIDKTDKHGNPVCHIFQADNGEKGLKIVAKFIAQFKNSVIVVDSVDTLVPEAMLQNDIGEATMGKHAKLMSDACRRFVSIAEKNKATVVFINQVREKMVAYGNPITTTGGRALPFYSSQRIELKKVAKADHIIDDEGKKTIGHYIHYQIIKNKLAPPYVTGQIPIIYGRGIWRELELVGLLCDMGLVEVGGKGGKQVKFSDEYGFLRADKAAKLLESSPDLFNEKKKLLLDNFFKKDED